MAVHSKDTDLQQVGPATPPAGARRGSLLRATVVMSVLAVLLSWVPAVGPLVAGIAGGREAGTAGRGAAVALLPAVLLAALVWIVLAAFELPVVGAVAGIGVAVVLVVELAPLLLGALLGGSWADRRT